jgi:hypothetical protein
MKRLLYGCNVKGKYVNDKVLQPTSTANKVCDK